jgi:hypothetical protein
MAIRQSISMGYKLPKKMVDSMLSSDGNTTSNSNTNTSSNWKGSLKLNSSQTTTSSSSSPSAAFTPKELVRKRDRDSIDSDEEL